MQNGGEMSAVLWLINCAAKLKASIMCLLMLVAFAPSYSHAWIPPEDGWEDPGPVPLIIPRPPPLCMYPSPMEVVKKTLTELCPADQGNVAFNAKPEDFAHYLIDGLKQMKAQDEAAYLEASAALATAIAKAAGLNSFDLAMATDFSDGIFSPDLEGIPQNDLVPKRGLKLPPTKAEVAKDLFKKSCKILFWASPVLDFYSMNNCLKDVGSQFKGCLKDCVKKYHLDAQSLCIDGCEELHTVDALACYAWNSIQVLDPGVIFIIELTGLYDFDRLWFPHWFESAKPASSDLPYCSETTIPDEKAEENQLN